MFLTEFTRPNANYPRVGQQALQLVLSTSALRSPTLSSMFPASARPFCTMPDPGCPWPFNSYDIFIRGRGSFRQSVYPRCCLPREEDEGSQDQPEAMTDYLNGFKWGCSPHGGSVDLERAVLPMLKLGDVRWAA